MKTVEFPLERAGVSRAESDLRRLSRLMRESALLLEACRVSSDSEFRSGAIDLAIRTMRAAGLAMDRLTEAQQPASKRRSASIVRGPWAAAELPAGTI